MKIDLKYRYAHSDPTAKDAIAQRVRDCLRRPKIPTAVSSRYDSALHRMRTSGRIW